MNKIVVEQKELHLDSESVILSAVPDDFSLYTKGNVSVLFDTLCFKNFSIYLEKGSHLLIEFFGEMYNQKNKVTIYNQENSVLDFHYACTYEKENELIIESNVSESFVRNYIKVRSVENNGTILIKALGTINEHTKDTLYLEDIKAITTNNHSVTIYPDLVVESNEVIANHNATISSVSESVLFYLMSRGISKDLATKLIKEGFLKGILQLKENK